MQAFATRTAYYTIALMLLVVVVLAVAALVVLFLVGIHLVPQAPN